MFDFNWELMVLWTVGIIAYFHLLRVAQRKPVLGIVELFVETPQRDNSGEYPEHFNIYTKTCAFIAPPVPGMEFHPSGIEGGQVLRVIIDDLGLLEVVCEMKISSYEGEFDETCELLESEGWRKKSFA